MCSFLTNEFFRNNVTLTQLQRKFINNANEYYDKMKKALLNEGVVFDYESKEELTIQFTAGKLINKINIDYSIQVVHLIANLTNITITSEKRSEISDLLKKIELHIPLGRFDLPNDGTVWFNISYSFINQDFKKELFLLYLDWVKFFPNKYYKIISE